MSDLRDRTDEMIHVRLPAEMRAALEREAARSERSLSGQVRYLIAQAVTQPSAAA